ncbi:GDSL-like Lipase/Acylhydrolase family protein [Raineyella antarctica]|uniref:GDSL-like Lipase/Acylhydrolase family protein n=1 Tax=Raineyella antarctica TaxID=1577474 RepID=A0A1G6HQS1_9ACTN|nr:SGNH/GDSL hydrolase family protein [Raineyella antarctica]SDB96647.1 GDSL-like Lipase/Acylhydrolase family protein [Raineyella antarctica]
MKRALSTLLATTALVASVFGAAGSAQAAPPIPAPVDYLALGDSYPAGVGVGMTDSYPALLGAKYSQLEVTNKAASGATTAGVVLQIGQANPTPDAITITVGANDVGWTTVLGACLTSPTGCNLANSTLGVALAAVPGGIVTDVAAAQATNPKAKIFVTGYPELFGSIAPGTTCDLGWTINPDTGLPVEVQANTIQGASVNALVDALNLAIQGGVTAAQAQGAKVTYVDASPAFTGHRLCDTSTAWLFDFNTAVAVGNPAAAFHPTVDGQQAYATTINKAGFRGAVKSAH